MGSALFACAYRLYLTPIGRSLHNRKLQDVRTSQVHPHSFFSPEQNVDRFVYGNIQVIPMPFLEDNLAYIVLDRTTHKYFLVDPADFEAIEEAKVAYNITGAPQAVVTTHKHWDHAGHNQQFVDTYPGIRVISGTNEPVYASTEDLADGQKLQDPLLDGKVQLEAFETPCHTAAHNMFILTVENVPVGVNKMIFTGDCLFEGGVGMFFEGNHSNMWQILDNLFERKFSEDHDRCVLFFGHDYGWKNYLWAAEHLFPGKDLPKEATASIHDVKERCERQSRELLDKRSRGFANTGTLLSDEMQSNLFMKAFLEAKKPIGDYDGRSLMLWVRSGFKPYDREIEEEYISPRQEAEAAIHDLRQSRTSFDGPINERATQMRTEQAGLHATVARPAL